MALPVIGYRSMLRESATVITDPGTASGYDINDIADLKSYSGWVSDTTVKPINIDIDTNATAQADYIAIVNSNLATLGATVQVLSGTSSPGATERLAATAVATDNVWYQGFTEATAERYWRIAITVAGASFASAPSAFEIFLGMKTELPEYLAPSFDPYLRDVEMQGSRSAGGHFLGGLTRGQTHRGTLAFGEAGIAKAYYTSDLNTFLHDHAFHRKPFVFVLDTDDADFDTAYYLRLTDNARTPRQAVGNSWLRMTADLEVEEAYVEPA
jgi:hypothetical protein